MECPKPSFLIRDLIGDVLQTSKSSGKLVFNILIIRTCHVTRHNNIIIYLISYENYLLGTAIPKYSLVIFSFSTLLLFTSLIKKKKKKGTCKSRPRFIELRVYSLVPAEMKLYL